MFSFHVSSPRPQSIYCGGIWQAFFSGPSVLHAMYFPGMKVKEIPFLKICFVGFKKCISFLLVHVLRGPNKWHSLTGKKKLLCIWFRLCNKHNCFNKVQTLSSFLVTFYFCGFMALGTLCWLKTVAKAFTQGLFIPGMVLYVD